MLRVLATTFRVGTTLNKPIKHAYVVSSSDTDFLLHGFSPVRGYAARPKQTLFLEENTLSSKILNYLRTGTKYSVADIPGIDRINSNVCNDAYAIHQMLLVISHSLVPKANDVLKLFSLYAILKHSILQDIISKKSLMVTVKKKVYDSVSLMTQDELRNFAVVLKEMNFQKTRYLMELAGYIDSECEKRAWNGNFEQCLELFDILLILYGNNIYRKKEYDTFMSLFEKHTESFQPQHLVKVLYYVGIGKKKKLSREFIDKLVRKLGVHYQDLSFQDAGIAASGVFKSNIKVDKASPFIIKMVQHFKTKVEECTSIYDLESYGLVAMMKLIRATKFQDIELFPPLNAFIMSTNLNTLSSEVVAHTLALYANTGVYHPEIFTKLQNILIHHLEDPSHTVRLKDLSRILWAFSHVSHQCDKAFFKEIDKYLMEFVYNGEIDTYPHYLSSTLLSMAVLEHYPQELIKETFRPERIHRLQGYQKSKQLSRLLMLNECLKLEFPELILEIPDISKSNLPLRTLTDETNHRPALATLMEGAFLINQIVGASVLKLKFPITHINYASLLFDNSELKDQNCIWLPNSTGQRDHVLQQLSMIKENFFVQHIAIELLDSHTTLSTSEPIGIVKMKMRLLSQRGWEVKKVHSKDVENCQGDVQALATLILNELTKVSI
ncbi:hypothetical protein OTU49_001262 [Cherax quadricarinatus]|uniref:Uncharacterized protein n=2 Tax=Cherax quadricarinatus TaxID=27406 RepID=A0AAW0XX99_CHEQU|nr:uncharacterized protein LOC128690934 [Cherax quadricarinatus]